MPPRKPGTNQRRRGVGEARGHTRQRVLRAASSKAGTVSDHTAKTYHGRAGGCALVCLHHDHVAPGRTSAFDSAKMHVDSRQTRRCDRKGSQTDDQSTRQRLKPRITALRLSRPLPLRAAPANSSRTIPSKYALQVLGIAVLLQGLACWRVGCTSSQLCTVRHEQHRPR